MYAPKNLPSSEQMSTAAEKQWMSEHSNLAPQASSLSGQYNASSESPYLHSPFENIASTLKSEQPQQFMSTPPEKLSSGDSIPRSFTPVATEYEQFIYTNSGEGGKESLLQAPDMQAFAKGLKAQLASFQEQTTESAQQGSAETLAELGCKHGKSKKDSCAQSSPAKFYPDGMALVSVKGTRLPSYVPEEPLPRELLGKRTI